jgi:hypothetical protein
MQNLVKNRTEVRSQGDENSPAYREQKELMDNIDSLRNQLEKYFPMI